MMSFAHAGGYLSVVDFSYESGGGDELGPARAWGRARVDLVAGERMTGWQHTVVVADSAPGALPGLAVPAAAAFIEAVGGDVHPKFGWTDVSRFSALSVPAVNFGPGDPNLAHTREEWVDVRRITACTELLRGYLS